MNFDWNDLQFFLALEREGTARAAAIKLKTSHSTVMRRLQQLEDVFGSILFDRTPDGFVITQAGAKILDKAQLVEADIMQMTKDVAGSDIKLEGPIRLTVPPPLIEHMLLPCMNAFRLKYPQIDLEIVATYQVSDLDRRDADIAIRFSNQPDEHLVGRLLPNFKDSIYATHRYVEDHNFTSEPSNLAQPEWIGWPEKKSFARRIKPTPFADASITWELPTIGIQLEAAKQGLGIALLPCNIGDKSCDLVRVPKAEIYPTRAAWILMHPNVRKLERVRVFSRYLTNAILAEKDLIEGLCPIG